MTLSFLDPSKAFDELNKYPSPDGLSIDQLMNTTLHGGLTYNDFLMLPGKIDFSAHDVITESRITRNVVLKTPFISSPMDTVTGDEMAISLAVRHSGDFHCLTSFMQIFATYSCWAASVLYTTISQLPRKLLWSVP